MDSLPPAGAPATSCRRIWLKLGGLLVACMLGFLAPVHASAHALLISSNPAAGETLGTGPGVVVLEFSQPLNPRLSSASVTDPTGHRWPGQVSGSEEIRMPVETNAAGTYTVNWTTVSLEDGHHVSGSFIFGVGSSPVARGAAGSGGNPQPGDVLTGIVKWVEALALLALLGQLLIAGLARRAPALSWVKPRLAPAPIALSAGLIVVWAEATAASGGHSAANFAAFFTSSLSGAARLARLGFEVLMVGSFLGRSRAVLWASTVGALVALSASGHAADVQPPWWGIGVDSLHLIAGGLWAGGIIGLAAQRPPGGWRSPGALQLLVRFSPVALTAFVVAIAGGGLEAVLQLGSLDALFGTSYGRVLLAKMSLVGFMLPLSFVAWRLRRPRPRIEATLAACVVAAAALLASFPLPPTEAASQAARQRSTPPSDGLPQPGDVTLAANAGSVLVGLSLEPGRPGRNRILVDLVPLEGNVAASALVANATIGTATVPLRSCGDACRQAWYDLRGGEAVAVDVLNPGGGRASFTVPPLPAPDGEASLVLMHRQMHALRSYQVAETLSSGLTTIVSSFAAVAPDRSAYAVNGFTDEIWIGTTQYTRTGPGQPWQVDRNLPRNLVPSFVWDYFEPLVDAHIVGQDTIDGTPATIVAAFGNRSGTPLWFRFWIDATGRVRQVDMDAPGHFMVDDYWTFNAPQITAPNASG